MPDEFRNLRIVHNGLSSQQLFRILHVRGWNERKLADRSGIVPSVVSGHLSGKQVIRSHHLSAYLKVIDRQERATFLAAWLCDNLDQELVADLLDGAKTDSMPTLKENQRRMLDEWATAIGHDSKLAKIFSYLTTKAGSKFPSLFLLPVSTVVAQFQSWLSEIASSGWYLARSVCSRVEHAAVALVMLVLALCQQGKGRQQPVELAGQAGELAEKTLATSLVATSFVVPALAETTNFEVDMQHASPRPPAVQATRSGKVGSRRNVRRNLSRARPQHENGPALRVGRTINHEWRRLVAARESVHSAFARLLDQPHPQQSKQKYRKHHKG